MVTITSGVLQPFSLPEASQPSQVYQELDKEKQEIRIAELFPKESRHQTGREYVSCHTRTTLLDRSLTEPYTALSYTWGDPERTVPMYLNNKRVQITENLSLALQHFEQRHLALRIWVDAICINQEDEAEKSQQVQIMADIYKRATEVLVWLGPAEDGSDDALEVLRQIGTEALELHHLSQPVIGCANTHKNSGEEFMDRDSLNALLTKWFPDKVPSFRLQSIQKLFQRSWFRRVWTLQEAAANENAMVYCGNTSIAKRTLWAGSRAIVALLNEVSQHDGAGVHNPIWQTLGGTNFIARRTLQLVTDAKRLPLQTLLMEVTTNLGSWAYEATDPRDRIFAVLGFSSDSVTLGIRSDYEKSCRRVFIEVAEAILTHSSNLDILYVISGSKNVKAMPSWVPDWSVLIPSTFGPRHIGKFHASGLNSLSYPRFETDEFGNRLLGLSGYRVDTVATIMEQTWDPYSEVHFHDDSPALEFAKSLRAFGKRQKTAYSSEEERYEALWRTPIADCDAQFNVMQKSRPSASLRMKISFEAFAGITEGDPEWRKITSEPYVHIMQLESARRRMFISKTGYYGLGQDTLLVGDVICTLHGGDSPFILRSAGLGYYELIGEAYVHGIMKGEHLKDNPPVEHFILC